MAGGKTIYLLCALLASLVFVIAQEESSNSSASNDQAPPATDDSSSNASQPTHDADHERASMFDIGQLFGGGSNTSSFDPFGQLISAFTQFMPGMGGSSGGFPNFFSFLPSSGRRELSLSPDSEAEQASPNDRFFFFHHQQNSNVPVGCNFTSQAGITCAGCREQLICNVNNVGRLRVCPFYAPYCLNGVCGNTVNTTCTTASTG